MKPENITYVKKTLTDADRDTCLKLLGCGLSTLEIVNVMHISKSTVSNIRQCHTACVNKDWGTVRRLSVTLKPTVEWALKVTNSVDEYQKACDATLAELVGGTEEEPVSATVTAEDVQNINGLLSGIYNLLTEIRDMLK